MKPQAKTMIERQGFLDPDRKNSKHDEIQLWAFEHVDEIILSFALPGCSLQIESKRLEYPVAQSNQNHFKMVAGYVDLYLWGYVLREGKEPYQFSVSMEVKSKIESCGDLIRQINFYKSYQNSPSTWVVVSPDDRFANVLKQQNIYFFKYKSPGELF